MIRARELTATYGNVTGVVRRGLKRKRREIEIYVDGEWRQTIFCDRRLECDEDLLGEVKDIYKWMKKLKERGGRS